MVRIIADVEYSVVVQGLANLFVQILNEPFVFPVISRTHKLSPTFLN